MLDLIEITPEPQEDTPLHDESEAMQRHDRDVINLSIRNTKGRQTWQVYRDVSIEQIVKLYSKTKKVAEARLSLYQPALRSDRVRVDQELVILMQPTQRGGTGSSLYVHMEGTWREIEFEDSDTTEDLRGYIQNHFYHMVYKGVELRDGILLKDLLDDRIYVQPNIPPSWLRS